jgi:GNAT superfamily N-acetyltransferase
MTEITIREVVIPSAIGDGTDGDFVAAVEVRNAVTADVWGMNHFAATPTEMLPDWQNQEHRPMRMFVAETADGVVARSIYDMTHGRDAAEVELVVQVHPAHRRRGIGSALLADLLRIAESDGRTEVQGYPRIGAYETDSWIVPGSGVGKLPSDNASTGFSLAHGFVLEQVLRQSELPLPPDAAVLDSLERQALAAASSDYRVLTWTGRTPEAWLSDVGMLLGRISTDAPTAGLASTEQYWDAERVRAKESAWLAAGDSIVTAVAEHVASGRLVAFSQLNVNPDIDAPVGQAETLVLREHRGHRLGALVKIANVRQLQEVYPGHPSIVTFNAEENRPMLAVNEAMGFVAAGYTGSWKKELERS